MLEKQGSRMTILGSPRKNKDGNVLRNSSPLIIGTYVQSLWQSSKTWNLVNGSYFLSLV